MTSFRGIEIKVEPWFTCSNCGEWTAPFRRVFKDEDICEFCEEMTWQEEASE